MAVWEYRIPRSDLGRNIYKRKVEENWLRQMRFLDWKWNWTLNKSYARTFYHREDAESVLWLMKIKDAKKPD